LGYFTPIIKEYLLTVSHLATGKLLDVGSGDKPYRNIFFNVDSYIGCDYLSKIEMKRVNEMERLAQVDVVGDACCLPFVRNSFDVVLSTQLIEHLPDPFVFFKEVSRVLVPSGYFIVTFPLVNPVHEQPYDFFRYTEYSIRQMCRLSGMKVEKVVRMGGGWLTVGYLTRHFLYRQSNRHRMFILRKALFLLGSIIYGLLARLDKINDQADTPLNYLIVARKLKNA